MFTSVGMRSANTYRAVGLETAVTGSDSHRLVGLLFDALQQSLITAKGGVLSGDVAVKARGISRSVRILEEGLKAALNEKDGGEIAANLRRLYDYCIFKTTEANMRNDVTALDEVIRLIEPVADGWSQIRNQVGLQQYQS